MSKDVERVTSPSNPTDVTREAGARTEFAWPPSSAVWASDAPLGPFESEITDVNSPSSRADLASPHSHVPDRGASSAESVQADDTPRFANNPAAPIPLEAFIPAHPRSSRHAPSATRTSPPHKGRRPFVQIGPALVAVLSLVALVQGAFILKTQFTPAESPAARPITPEESRAERPTIPQPVLAAATQPLAQKMSAPTAVTESPSPIRSSDATKQVSGRLLVRSDPAGAKVLVDGRSQGVTPLNLAGVAPGSHRVVVSGAGREVQQTVQIEAGSTVSVVIPLRSTAERGAFGRVSIVAPLELDIFEGETLVGTSRMRELILSPGPHTLRFVNEAFGYEDTRKIEVEAGERVSVPVHVPQGELNVNALPWAEVSIDGNRIGETPLGNLKLAVGPHVATFRHPELGEKTVSFAVKVGVPARVTADMRK